MISETKLATIDNSTPFIILLRSLSTTWVDSTSFGGKSGLPYRYILRVFVYIQGNK